jgi:hypothetical protein
LPYALGSVSKVAVLAKYEPEVKVAVLAEYEPEVKVAVLAEYERCRPKFPLFLGENGDIELVWKPSLALDRSRTRLQRPPPSR